MFEVINAWNLVCPSGELENAISNINLRAYNKETYLTGEFASKLSNNEIRPLSVSNIADRYCPTRRDLYFYKGINRLSRLSSDEHWGGKAGYIVEDYVKCISEHEENLALNNYSSLVEQGNTLHDTFCGEKTESISNLRNLEGSTLSGNEGDTDWLLTLLSYTGRAELAIKILHSTLKEEGSLDMNHVQVNQHIEPNITEIGLNSPAKPDFIVPQFKITGDIKTGVNFEPHYQLTCAGYALAYENWMKDESDINWGIIYFFPTRNPSAYVRPITFTQIYIFPIDDYLRQWFLDLRDEAYNIISKENHPSFPAEDNRTHCRYCKFKSHCISEGLELSDEYQ